MKTLNEPLRPTKGKLALAVILFLALPAPFNVYPHTLQMAVLCGNDPFSSCANYGKYCFNLDEALFPPLKGLNILATIILGTLNNETYTCFDGFFQHILLNGILGYLLVAILYLCLLSYLLSSLIMSLIPGGKRRT